MAHKAKKKIKISVVSRESVQDLELYEHNRLCRSNGPRMRLRYYLEGRRFARWVYEYATSSFYQGLKDQIATIEGPDEEQDGN